MRRLRFAGIWLSVIALGCSTVRQDAVPADGIIPALQSRSRNTTRIALWTLEQNGFIVPVVFYEKPYAEAKPALNQLVENLQQLPAPKLAKLDGSFKYYQGIYSSVFHKGGNGWKP
ncbi:MAG: hypothetical protein C0404_00145 [Verrucomicrobia bacterium]|nr:hypothetical protein [Verrucomicrobiota bacterium]